MTTDWTTHGDKRFLFTPKRPVPLWVAAGGYYTEVKRPMRKAGQAPALVPKLILRGSAPPLPNVVMARAGKLCLITRNSIRTVTTTAPSNSPCNIILHIM